MWASVTGMQAASPVDSYAAPEPCPEPGYTDEVIMASGSFTQGSTIELSCDGPLRAPYTCYLQGGLNFAASRAGVLLAIQKAYFKLIGSLKNNVKSLRQQLTRLRLLKTGKVVIPKLAASA